MKILFFIFLLAISPYLSLGTLVKNYLDTGQPFYIREIGSITAASYSYPYDGYFGAEFYEPHKLKDMYYAVDYDASGNFGKVGCYLIFN